MDSQEPDQSGNFSLEVENFGPIARASVDLRPLTVFVGPSNTGKSYLAILAYALHQSLGESSFRPIGRRSGYSFPFSAVSSMRRRSSLFNNLLAWFSTGLDEDVLETKSEIVLPEDVAVGIRSFLKEPPGFDQYLENEILRCFGSEDHDELVRHQSNRADAVVSLDVPQRGTSQPVRFRFAFGRGATRFSGNVPGDQPLTIRGDYSRHLRDLAMRSRMYMGQEGLAEREASYLIQSLLDLGFLSLLQPLASDAFYLPASRTGVMHSHQVVVSALIQNATTAGLRPSPDVPVLSGVLADFMDEILGMSAEYPTRHRGRRRRYPRKPSEELAKYLETNILQGTVRILSAETNYPVFSYRPRDWKNDVPLMRTSSMVSELAPLVLYLRHLVRPGDLLIIEEPESHLHPEMQAALAHELARLVQFGIRIILTTHSEWFLEQIGNLIRLSMLPKDKQLGITSTNVALAPDQVGAWLFTPKKRPRGSVVEEIKLDPETGLFPSGYDVVSEALYNTSAQIFNRLQEGTD